MRKLIEAVEAKEITEGRYGPHGMGRRVNDGVDNIFDRRLQELGSDPTVEEIYDAMRNVRRDLAAEELMGFPRTNSYINKQFLGLVAETLELPGLYGPSGRVFYSVEKDDAGRYTGSGGASRQVAQELAEKGYLSPEAAERLGVTRFLGMEFGDGDSDEANATRDAQTMASGRRNVRRQVSRFMELLAKRNEGNDPATEGVAITSLLGRLLTEALTDAEEAEFQELLATIKDLPLDAYADDEETRNAVQAAQTEIERIAAEPTAAAEPAATTDAQNDADSQDSGTSGDTGMSLSDFADSGNGGIKNDPQYTAAIEQLQEFLKTMGWDIGVDGRYGPQTTSAVKEFQQLVGLGDDGDAGPQTIEKILVWGTLPDVKNWAAQVKELNDLIDQGAVFQAPSNESVVDSFRSMMSLVESLFEEVTDQQQARAMELYNELKTKIEGDGEYMAALPEVLRTQLTAAAEWARPGDDIANVPDDEAEVEVDALDAAGKAAAIYRGLDGAGTSEEDVIAVLGSIATPQELAAVEQVFLELSGGTAMKDWLDSDTSNIFDGEDTQQQVNDIYARLAGPEGDPGSLDAVVEQADAAEALYQAMTDGWFFGLGTEEQAVLGILGKITTNSWANVQQIYQTQYNRELLDHLSREFGGADLVNLNKALARFNVEITGAGEWGEPGAAADAAPAAQAADGDVTGYGSMSPEEIAAQAASGQGFGG